MIITGKKIVKLTLEEKDVLANAIDLLNALSKALGDDDFYDFLELSETLYYIRDTGEFETEYFEQ